MISATDGKITSEVEVTHISSHGVWLLAQGRELFMSYEEFPWFKDLSVRAIINVQEPSPGHYFWPEADIDLTLEIIEHPERFPLKARM
ncbi:MAG: integron cassette protein [Desulfobulbaceae bacterium DB1]|nr:MAG: integron cassette protein [Desulfobulbaceae bacterium DB1]